MKQRKNYNRKNNVESKHQAERTELRRARITALVLASLTILAMLSFVYGFIQKTQADKLEMRASQLDSELENCKQEFEACKQNR